MGIRHDLIVPSSAFNCLAFNQDYREVNMEIQCPQCGGFHIKERNHAQKTLGLIGTIAGGSIGVRTVLYSGNIGARIGMAAGPPGTIAGMLVGCIFGALVSGNLGCEIGCTVGKQIDQNILNNYVCCDCDCAFSKDQDSQNSESMLFHNSP